MLSEHARLLSRLEYDTSDRIVFVRFLEEFKNTKKTFRNKLTSTYVTRTHMYVVDRV